MKKQLLCKLLLGFLYLPIQTFAGYFTFNPGDNVLLNTDRSIYITGEQVHFFATVWNGDDLNKPVQSQILYCEIITPDGDKIAGAKFLTNQPSVGGCVNIPRNVLTGYYYIRAYTKLMRNYGPESYGYKQIRIINPGRVEILATSNNKNTPGLKMIQPTSDGFKDMLIVSSDKAVYGARDTITISVQTTNSPVSGFKNVSLSVVPEGTQSSSILLQSSKKMTNEKSGYYPETRGLSISGKLTEASSTNPIPGKKVNLSIIGEGRNFMALRADSSGRFFFALPDYYGSRDLFICAEKTGLLNVKIWIDNDFCTTPFQLPTPEFTLTEQERITAQNMAQNMQINSRFYPDSLQEIQSTNKEESAFYGQPSAVIYLDKYIQLPTLEEYFNELPSQVKVRKRKGESYFSIQSSGTANLSFYDPLVLVDWVAVDEPSKILAVSPQNISRIEVVNEDYVKGGQTYGGIISIISKKGDFAGIDLPSTGIFISYHFLDENNCVEKNKYSATNMPDVRNTILWKPDIPLQKSKAEKIVFTAPDTPGKYSIVFEGVTTKGEVFSVTNSFEVNN